MTIKVYWPDDLDMAVTEELYGWKLADDWLVVAGTLPSVSPPRCTISVRANVRESANQLVPGCSRGRITHPSRTLSGKLISTTPIYHLQATQHRPPSLLRSALRQPAPGRSTRNASSGILGFESLAEAVRSVPRRGGQQASGESFGGNVGVD